MLWIPSRAAYAGRAAIGKVAVGALPFETAPEAKVVYIPTAAALRAGRRATVRESNGQGAHIANLFPSEFRRPFWLPGGMAARALAMRSHERG